MLILSLHLFRGRNQFHLVQAKPQDVLLRPVVLLGLPSLLSELSSGIVMVVLVGMSAVIYMTIFLLAEPIAMAFFLSYAAGITGVWLAFPVTEGLVAAVGGILLAKA